MANYDANFAYDFIKRTRQILDEYSGEYPATLLCNTLLGLLVVPREELIDRLPSKPITSLTDWCLSGTATIKFGTQRYRNVRGLPPQPLPYVPDSVAGFVHSLRNAICHFKFDPIRGEQGVTGFRFEDSDKGFEATLTRDEIVGFARKLSDSLLPEIEKDQPA